MSVQPPPPPYLSTPRPTRRRWPIVVGVVALVVLAAGGVAGWLLSRDEGGSDESVVAEDASAQWIVELEPDYSPVDAVRVDDVVVVSESWEIDEDSSVTAYGPEGAKLWTYDAVYGAPYLQADDGQVQICSDNGTVWVSLEDGTVQDQSESTDCSKGGDVNIDRYRVADDRLIVLDENEDEELYAIDLLDRGAEVWGLDGAVVTFADGNVTYYR